MATPLELYEQVAKDFGVTEDKQLHSRQKQAFIESQVGEIKAVINRLVVDTAKSRQDLADAKDDATKGAYQKKVGEFETELRQFVKTLDFFQQLAKAWGVSGEPEPTADSL